MCRKSTSPPTRKAFYTSCVCIFLPKKRNDEKGVCLTFFQSFSQSESDLFRLFLLGPIPTQGDRCIIESLKGRNAFAGRHDPTAKKMSHRSGSVSPFSLQFFWNVTMTTTPQNPSKPSKTSKKSHPFFLHKKKAKRTKNGRFQATHSLPWPKSAPPFSVPTFRRVKFIPLNRGPKDSKEGQEGNLPTHYFSADI